MHLKYTILRREKFVGQMILTIFVVDFVRVIVFFSFNLCLLNMGRLFLLSASPIAIVKIMNNNCSKSHKF